MAAGGYAMNDRFKLLEVNDDALDIPEDFESARDELWKVETLLLACRLGNRRISSKGFQGLLQGSQASTPHAGASWNGVTQPAPGAKTFSRTALGMRLLCQKPDGAGGLARDWTRRPFFLSGLFMPPAACSSDGWPS